MKMTNREITKEEYNAILDDFKQIELEYQVPDAKTKRLNVTVEENNEVIGFASGLVNHQWFNLTDLWIDRNYRHQGLGAKILKQLEEEAVKEGIKHIYTWTTGYNSNELFYQKQGYQKCLIFEDFFEVKDGHHICLKKEL